MTCREKEISLLKGPLFDLLTLFGGIVLILTANRRV